MAHEKHERVPNLRAISALSAIHMNAPAALPESSFVFFVGPFLFPCESVWVRGLSFFQC